MNLPKWPQSGQRERDLLERVLSSGQWGGFHEIIAEFETAFARYQDARFGIAACNGTMTLELGLAAIGAGPGDEVIVPAISFISTATAVSRTGAIPVFVDIDGETMNLDPQRVEEAITSRTKAVIAVHFGGPMAEIEALSAICRARGIELVEDAAHAQGSSWNGRRAGSWGLWASFSFQNGKVLTAGEGGMLTSNDEPMAARLWSLVNQGRQAGKPFFFHYDLGTNARMTALQAAVLLAQFERLPEQIALRQHNDRRWREELRGIPGLRFQRVPAAAADHACYLLPGRIDESAFGVSRDEFHRRTTAAGVPMTPFYPHPLYGNPVYRDGIAPCRVMACPQAEACIRDAFWFPHRVLMADDETTEEILRLITNQR